MLFSTTCLAQVVVTFPLDRSVFQRSQANDARVHIGGYITETFERIEARFVPIVSGEGQPSPADGNWAVIDEHLDAGHFEGNMLVRGGWYKLEVRGIRENGEPRTTSVAHVGVGEVFIVAGQSNAAGGGANPNGPGAVYDQVNSVDFQNLENGEPLRYHSIVPPCLEFVHLDAPVKTAPFGNYAWCWGSFGDQLYQKLRVPIMIFNTGWSGSGIENWRKTIDPNNTTESVYGYTFPAGLPFGHLRLALHFYASQLGVRAVLWHQGETDNLLEFPGDNTYERYLSSLWDVIRMSRTLTGKENLAWMVARASRFNVNGKSRTSPRVVKAQNELIDNDIAYPHVFQGPDTDPYYSIEYRADEEHFRGDGITKSPDGRVYSGLIHLARFWVQQITTQFLSESVPYPATPPPAVTAAYKSDGLQMLFKASGSSGTQFRWFGDNCRDELASQQEWTTGAGIYRVKTLDTWGNVAFSHRLRVSGTMVPVIWKSFRAQPESEDQVRLTWSAPGGTPASSFEIQRSTDGLTFERLGTVPANEESSSPVEYQYHDELPMAARYFYRIKRLNVDDTMELSNTVSTSPGSAAFIVFPNPVTDRLNIQNNMPLGRVRIVNMLGQTVLEVTEQSHSLNIPVAHLAAGMYVIWVNGSSSRFQKK